LVTMLKSIEYVMFGSCENVTRTFPVKFCQIPQKIRELTMLQVP
jgi:hypothetical protein